MFCVLACLLVMVSVADIKTKEIPDRFNVAIGVLGVVWVLWQLFDTGAVGRVLLNHGLGVLAGFLPLFLVDDICLRCLGREGMGGGDMKLMAACGLVLGWKLTLLALFFGVLAGGLFGAVMLSLRRLGRRQTFAFGPFLAAGTLISFRFGQTMLDWYFSMF